MATSCRSDAERAAFDLATNESGLSCRGFDAERVIIGAMVSRSAGVWLRPEVLILIAHLGVRGGPRYATLPVARLSPTSGVTEIGLTLRSMLGCYEEVNDISDEDHHARGVVLLRAMKFRSWRSLEAGAKSCLIGEDQGALVFTPLRNGGTRGPRKGFQPFGAADISLPGDASNSAMGRALMDALARSA